MSVTDWSPQPGGNALADRAIPARDGLSGREIPQAIRGLMAGVSAFVLDQNGSLTTGGSANAYTLLTHSGITGLKPGLSVSFLADRDNTDVPTLNVDGLGPKPFLTPSGLPLAPSAIKRGLNYTVVWTDAIDALPAGWRLKGAAAVLNGNDFSALGDTAVYDRDHVAVASEVQIGFRALTAPRFVTLPDVDTFPLGQDLVVADQSGACSDTLTITIQPGAGTGDTISGVSQVVLNSPYQTIRLRRAGAGVWSIQADRLAGLDDASKAVTRRNLGLGRFAFSVTRTQIATSPLSALTDRFTIGGWNSFGDGSGGDYVRDPSNGSGPMAIQDSLGAWWMLDLSGPMAEVGWFGPLGTADDSDTINRAIQTVSPYVWKGSADATRRDSRSGAIAFPRRPLFCAKKIRLAPNIWLVGQSTLNEWSARLDKDAPVPATDWSRLGSALVFTIDDPYTYAIDTSPMNGSGVRVDDALVVGPQIATGDVVPVDGVVLENLSIVGRGTCKGINMAASMRHRIKGCEVSNFIVNYRPSSCWYSTVEDTQFRTRWRGIVHYFCTDLTFRNVNVLGIYDRTRYSGLDTKADGSHSSHPPINPYWTDDVNRMEAGIFGYYSNATGYSVTVEQLDVAFMGYNNTHDLTGIYVEIIDRYIILEQGPDQQHGRYSFETITTCKGHLIWSFNARLDVNAVNNNYTQGGFGNLIGDLINTIGPEFRPKISGLLRKSSDVFTDEHIQQAGLVQRAISFTPTILCGGVSAGPQTQHTGRAIRIGTLVFVSGRVVLDAKGGATGLLAIGGLPWRVRDFFGHHGSGSVSFSFSSNLPNSGSILDLQNGGYEGFLRGHTDADLLDGAELRFSAVYETDEQIYA